MSVLKIYTDDHPMLREKSQPVPSITKEVKQFIADMRQTMQIKQGMGLAAPQVGVLQRIIMFEYKPDNKRYLGYQAIPFGVIINPHIYWRSKKMCLFEEGCLSLPEIYEPITRPEAIKVSGLDAQGKKINIHAHDILARVIQHEVDHLDGILFVDYLEGVPKQIAALRKVLPTRKSKQ